jgi:DnaK suppressor protein
MTTDRRATHLSDVDLERLRQALVRERNALVAAERALAGVARGGAGGEIEDGDIAERMAAQENALPLASFDAGRLAEVDVALRKLEAGTYGVSELSGAPIPLERLDLVPWARLTVEEEERRERS